MEKTFVLLKPDTISRGFIGKIITRFEEKGLKLVGIKMVKLDDDILEIHYKHLGDKPFFQRIKSYMKSTPVIVTCWEGLEAVETVRKICGVTNARKAETGTIRGDFAMSLQANLVHTSDTLNNATDEINRFFVQNELFDYCLPTFDFLYSSDELQL